MTTATVHVPAIAHTKNGHPENQNRLNKLLPFLDRAGILADLHLLQPVSATLEQLRRVHTPALIERIREVSSLGGGILDQGDTYATPNSFELARSAAGSAIAVVDQIMTGQARNGFALVRPPGHHAEYGRISGFCLFNNVAAAARQAQAIQTSSVSSSSILTFITATAPRTSSMKMTPFCLSRPICFYRACFIQVRAICRSLAMGLGMGQ